MRCGGDPSREVSLYRVRSERANQLTPDKEVRPTNKRNVRKEEENKSSPYEQTSQPKCWQQREQ